MENKTVQTGVQIRSKAALVGRFCKSNLALVCFFLLLAFMAIVAPKYFSYNTFCSLFTSISAFGVIACAMTISLIGGEFDLSVGATIPFSTLLFSYFLPRVGLAGAIGISLLMGLVVGAINGALVGYVKINGFIVTLAMLISLSGIMLVFCQGLPIGARNPVTRRFGTGKVLGISYITFVYLFLAGLSEFILRKTRYGRSVYAVGGNYEAAQNAGINVRLVKMSLFMLLGLFSVISGIMMACRLQAGSALYGSDACMQVVCAAVLGGTSISGGKGSALRTIIGMLVLGVLTQMFSYLSVISYLRQLVQGIVVIIVLVMDATINRKK